MRGISSNQTVRVSRQKAGKAQPLPGGHETDAGLNADTFLRERGIQPSHQRIRIYEVLAGTKEHPSADVIHSLLVREIPTLSRTTVYSTLVLFAERGIAQRLALTGSEVRYDADISIHAHFRCRSCGEVMDIPGLDVPVHPKKIHGFRVERAQYFLEGLCRECALD